MIDYAQKYINAVESGDIIVGKKIQQAIDRHLNDIEKSKNKDYPYIYDINKTQIPIKFIGALPDPKSGKPNQLALFQMFILSLILDGCTRKQATDDLKKYTYHWRENKVNH